MLRNAKFFVFLLCALFMFTQQGCGKSEDELAGVDEETAGTFVSADNPNASITSTTLKRLKGRWVKEITDPRRPNPPTMRLFAHADNVLAGRFLVAGGYADVGVAATIKDENGLITMTLVDDELRPHDWVPPRRTFTGRFDEEKIQLKLTADNGEYVLFQFNNDPMKQWQTHYSARIYKCVLVPTPIPSPGAPSGPSGGTGSGPSPSPSPAPTAAPRPPANDDDDNDSFSPLRVHNIPFAPIAMATPTPTPTNTPPVVAVNSCGVSSSSKEEWSRMSGSRANGE